MQDAENSITPDRQERLAESFEHIDLLINNNELEAARTEILQLHYADLADFLDNTNHRLYPVILPIIADELKPETLVSLSDSSKQPALEALGLQNSSNLINQMDIEDSIEVVEELDNEFKQTLLESIDTERKNQILEGFKYPENTVGRIVEKDFVAFQQHWTVGQAIDYIRRSKIEQDFHAAIIVDSRYKPVGSILLSTLLKNTRNTSLLELINPEFKVADTFTALDELAFIFKQYALTIVPVINKSGKLVGSVSIDNMLYIIEERTESEFMQLGGISTFDIFENLLATSKQRFPWLFVNLITACITSLIINEFNDTISKIITLATIMPIVAALSGNAGTQVMTVMVRAIANREITKNNTTKIILKEALICGTNGILIAIIGAALTYALFDEMRISCVFAASVLINFTIAGLLGSGIPIVINSLELDPATASGVFVTACTDALGFFSFLSLAYYFLT